MPRNVLFMGSMSSEVARTPEEAMGVFNDALAGSLVLPPELRDDEGLLEGDNYKLPLQAPGLPTGETGDTNWIQEQLEQLGKVPGVRVHKRANFTSGSYIKGTPLYTVSRRKSLNPDDINLLYFDRAQEAWPAFQALREGRGLEGQKLQIGINVLDIALFAFWLGGRHLDAMLEATRRETQKIWDLTGGQVFFLIETPCANILSSLARGNDKLLDWLTSALVRVVGSLPGGAEFGFHFCYGDLSHASVADHGWLAQRLKLRRLYDLQFMVDLSNALATKLAAHNRLPKLMQFPLALGKRPPSVNLADYEELRRLWLPVGVEFYAGLVHEGLPVETLALLLFWIEVLLGEQVGISNSCGFGRMAVEDVYDCLLKTRWLVNAVSTV